LNICWIASNGFFPAFCERLLMLFLESFSVRFISFDHIFTPAHFVSWIDQAALSAALIAL